MNVLVLTAKAIWPLLGGAEIRNFSLLKETSKHHRVFLLSFLLGENDRDHFDGLEPFCEKIVGLDLRRPLAGRLVRAARSIGGRRPFIVSEYARREMSLALERIVREEQIDVIHAHFLHVAQYAGWKGRAAFVYDAHNLEHILWKRFARVQSNPVMRTFSRLQLPKFVEWQRRVARQSDAVVTLSDVDRDEFLRIAPGTDVTTVPNGADVEYFHPLDIPEEEHSIIYFANFGWPPQDDAAVYFCNEIFPSVRAKYNDAHLYLVGKTPPEKVRTLATDDVTVTGFVEDIREYIARAAVVVLPLRVGAGTKHRAFQALAMEKPLVTTTVGAEGIALEHGRTAMITDDPGEFARHTIDLLGDSGKRRAMGRTGRQLVLDRYTWSANYAVLEDVFARAVKRRQSAEELV